ncbi:hypothetical protein [Streptomyces sp. NPDC056144]|uniref:hypothetical protein n=1 Tax=unclassified Streptomyces TaxID=2593676 RepID=UPI0035DBCE88
MSATHERPTLAPSLYAYARDLRNAAPDAPLPDGGYALPEKARRRGRRREGLTWREACAAVTGALAPLIADPDTGRAGAWAPRSLASTGAAARTVYRAVATWPALDEPASRTRARAFGRHLTRYGTDLLAVTAGLGILSRLGEPEDVPYLRTLGLLDEVGVHAAETLEPLDRASSAFVWLIHRARADALRGFVDALATGDGTADLLVDLPTGPRELGPEHARRVAEAVGLPDLLRRHPDHSGLLARALHLLTRMCHGRNYESEILAYDEAVALFEAVATRAYELPPLLDHRASLVSLALDLHSGAAHLLPWPPERRQETIHTLLSAVGDSATPLDREARRRVDWIRRTSRRLWANTPAVPSETPRLRIEVTVADPGDPDVVETRLLVDGRPLVPAFFGHGPAEPPERLLDDGALRADSEPREVRLAEAYCTEGCCGALYVTVRREGAHVVWDGWRRPNTPSRPPLGLPEAPVAYRFDADAYDAEIARAEQDRSWAWPARRTAALISAGLRERPDLLGRWGLARGWISTDFHQPDITVVTFDGLPLGADGTPDAEQHARQFLWRLPDDGSPPEERAAAVLRRLAEEDPRRYRELGG